MFKSFAEIEAARKLLNDRSTALQYDIEVFHQTEKEFSDKYGLYIKEDEDEDNIINIATRFKMDDSFIEAVGKIKGVADATKINDYEADITKGTAFSWDEIRDSLVTVHQTYIDNLISSQTEIVTA